MSCKYVYKIFLVTVMFGSHYILFGNTKEPIKICLTPLPDVEA